MKHLKDTVARWKKETNIGFALYGTPAESLCYRFARVDKERFGDIEDITDKGYYTNSYHVDVREKISAFDKLKFESKYQPISSGGAISYVEIPNMKNNLEALEEIVKFIYDNIQYAEFNTKSDYCQVCGFDGEIQINDENEWECPQCGNKDHSKMNVTRRTCGYLGENFWNVGKTKEIKARVTHLQETDMNYASIKNCDVANGIGIRISLFVSGCRHKCKNCFNQEAWDFTYGEKFTEETLEQCDDVFYENEDEINHALEEYASKIEL